MKRRHWLLPVVGVAGALGPLIALAEQVQQPSNPQQPPWDWYGPWHMHMWSGWGFWWIFPLFMFFMFLICVVIFFLGHRMGGARHSWGPWHAMGGSPESDRVWSDPTGSALRILNERFARGEIQKQEYEEKTAAIVSSRQHLKH